MNATRERRATPRCMMSPRCLDSPWCTLHDVMPWKKQTVYVVCTVFPTFPGCAVKQSAVRTALILAHIWLQSKHNITWLVKMNEAMLVAFHRKWRSLITFWYGDIHIWRPRWGGLAQRQTRVLIGCLSFSVAKGGGSNPNNFVDVVYESSLCGRPYTTQAAENAQAKIKIPRPVWKYPGHIKIAHLDSNTAHRW